VLAAQRCDAHLKQGGIVLNHPQKAQGAVDSLINGELVHPLRVAKPKKPRKFQPGFLYALSGTTGFYMS